MMRLCDKLCELAHQADVIGSEEYKVDPLTADLVWSVAGRLRHRADQLEPQESLKRQINEESEHMEPLRKSSIGSAIRERVRQATQRVEDDGPPPLRRKRMTQDD
jgi:hypothetical protein